MTNIYGINGKITKKRDGRYRLIVRNSYGMVISDKIYATERGAKIAWAKYSAL